MPDIKGYRVLSKEETDLINEGKELAETVRKYVEKLAFNGRQDIDQRWVALGRTQLQQGFMALTRAVAQPTTF
jgi:hypothetical protein